METRAAYDKRYCKLHAKERNERAKLWYRKNKSRAKAAQMERRQLQQFAMQLLAAKIEGSP